VPTEVIHGDCLEVLRGMDAGTFDAVVTDPPYPCIKRSYGYWTEAEWFALMNPVVEECRRVLKPSGSAVFILQPNSEKVGRMRTWLWEFMAKWGREWGMVQDAWWWNPTRCPTVHSQREHGLMRPSVKACIWFGDPDCWRDQESVLWSQSDGNAAVSRSDRLLRRNPSGNSMRKGRCAAVADVRGGVTPFNLLPISTHDSRTNAGAHGHGAGTPLALCRWWTRYICPPGGRVLDPFVGSGTTLLAAMKEGREGVGIEKDATYCSIARRRIAEAEAETPLFAGVA
jgi:DNA modification methylase